MSLLAALIRRRKLDADRQRQELAVLRRQRDRAEAALRGQRDIAGGTDAGLRELLAAGRLLDVQRLGHARDYQRQARQRLTEMEDRLALDDSAIKGLERQTTQLERRIEKLEAIAAERTRQAGIEQQRREWLLLDEWVVNRRGGIP